MSPARFRPRDIERAVGMTTHKLSQHVDRCVIHLSTGDVDANGSGNCRKFTQETVRWPAMVHALTAAGISPRMASRVTAQFHAATVVPGDLIIVDASGDGRITRELQIGSVGRIVLDLGKLF